MSRGFSNVGGQVELASLGWAVYSATSDPLDLAWLGLAQFFPVLALALPAGTVADRRDRARVLGWATIGQGMVSAGSAVLVWMGWVSPWTVVAIGLTMGTLRAFSGPASQALLPSLVPVDIFPRALAIGSMTWQLSMIVGPSLAGGVIGAGGGAAGALLVASVLQVSAGAVALGLPKTRATPGGASTWADLLAGLKFVQKTRLLLACISLDLFAVLLGGATALMPIFARDVLKVGPEGFGLLRSAPAIGAVIMAWLLGRHALRRHAGWIMLAAVAVFGLGTIVFGVSRSFPLSVAALVVLGAADMVSVVVRHMVVQLGTPDEVRGRVSAVNLVFIGASNELGEFESGVAARLLGPVAAVVLGGIGTLAVVTTWAWWFPELRNADRLEAITPRTVNAPADPRPGDPPAVA